MQASELATEVAEWEREYRDLVLPLPQFLPGSCKGN